MPADDIASGFDRRGPWVSRFVIGGRPYGGNISFDADVRIGQFFSCFPDALRILDLGSLEGGQTFGLAKRPGARVLGLEGRRANIEKAEYVRGLLGAGNVRFELADLESAPLAGFGAFDAVFCSGLLYHLPKPWELIRQIGLVSDKVFIWTHYARPEQATGSRDGYAGYDYREFGLGDPLSGLSAHSFRVTRGSLMDMLGRYGFAGIRVFEDNAGHPHGPSITLGAWKN
jgi:SAM-dependent methyltransferase